MWLEGLVVLAVVAFAYFLIFGVSDD